MRGRPVPSPLDRWTSSGNRLSNIIFIKSYQIDLTGETRAVLSRKCETNIRVRRAADGVPIPRRARPPTIGRRPFLRPGDPGESVIDGGRERDPHRDPHRPGQIRPRRVGGDHRVQVLQHGRPVAHRRQARVHLLARIGHRGSAAEGCELLRAGALLEANQADILDSGQAVVQRWRI